MKYSMNYYSKKTLEFKDTFIQDWEIYESITHKEKRRSLAGNATKETSRFQFVVPWQLP